MDHRALGVQGLIGGGCDSAAVHWVSWYVDGYVLVEERTWIGTWIDRRAHGFYGLPGTPFDAKAIILDKHGNRVKLPTR